jgi:hypothetical protein
MCLHKVLAVLAEEVRVPEVQVGRVSAGQAELAAVAPDRAASGVAHRIWAPIQAACPLAITPCGTITDIIAIRADCAVARTCFQPAVRTKADSKISWSHRLVGASRPPPARDDRGSAFVIEQVREAAG